MKTEILSATKFLLFANTSISVFPQQVSIVETILFLASGHKVYQMPKTSPGGKINKL